MPSPSTVFDFHGYFVNFSNSSVYTRYYEWAGPFPEAEICLFLLLAHICTPLLRIIGSVAKRSDILSLRYADFSTGLARRAPATTLSAGSLASKLQPMHASVQHGEGCQHKSASSLNIMINAVLYTYIV